MTYYRNPEDRDKAGKEAVAAYLDSDGWSGAVECVAAGEVTHSARCRDKKARPYDLDENGCDAEGVYWGDSESMGNYTFEPLGPSAP